MTTPAVRAFTRLIDDPYEALKEVIDEVRAQYPSYAPVTDALLASSFDQNMRMSRECVLAGSPPDADTMTNYAQISRARLDSGVPVEDLMASFRFSMGRIADHLDRLMKEERATTEERLDAYRKIWMVSDAYTTSLVNEYRHHALQVAADDYRFQVDLFRALAERGPKPNPLDETSTRGLLSLRLTYRGFVAKREDGQLGQDHQLRESISKLIGPGQGLCVVQHGRVEGVVGRRFTAPPGASVSFGELAPVPELHNSIALARAVADTSPARHPGTHTLSDVSWRIAASPECPLTRHYMERFHRLWAAPEASRSTLLDSFRTLAAHHFNFSTAAESLHCHPNTLRYRAARLEELTGTNMRDLDGLIALAWAIELAARRKGD